MEITTEMTSFACGYCGASQIVERQGGTISLRLIEDAIGKVQVGTDKTAAELAIKRLGAELIAVEETYNQTLDAKRKQLDTNGQVFAVVWIIGVIVGLSFMFQGGVIGTLAVILIIAGTVAVIYFWNKECTSIGLRFSETEKALINEGNLIRNKIKENRLLVD